MRFTFKITVSPIESTLKERLGKVARGYGLNMSTLARMWLVEKLKETQSKWVCAVCLLLYLLAGGFFE